MYRCIVVISIFFIGILFPFTIYSQEHNFHDSTRLDCTISPGEVYFPSRSITLTKDACRQLRGLAQEIKNNQSCIVIITGRDCKKISQQEKAWERVYAVYKYLTSLGVDYHNLIIQYGLPRKENVVSYRAALKHEQDHCTTPPFPNIRRD